MSLPIIQQFTDGWLVRDIFRPFFHICSCIVLLNSCLYRLMHSHCHSNMHDKWEMFCLECQVWTSCILWILVEKDMDSLPIVVQLLYNRTCRGHQIRFLWSSARMVEVVILRCAALETLSRHCCLSTSACVFDWKAGSVFPTKVGDLGGITWRQCGAEVEDGVGVHKELDRSDKSLTLISFNFTKLMIDYRVLEKWMEKTIIAFENNKKLRGRKTPLVLHGSSELDDRDKREEPLNCMRWRDIVNVIGPSHVGVYVVFHFAGTGAEWVGGRAFFGHYNSIEEQNFTKRAADNLKCCN